ncbi:MAG: DUF5330 domain-containing protein [Flavobacteriaceae bacterium]
MSFLFKAAFWLSIAILFLPVDDGGQTHKDVTLSASDAIHVASSTIGDMRGFCDRNPQTCEAGGEALRTFGLKAQYGAKLIYNYLDGLNAGEDAENTATRSNNTLSPEDRQPAWRGPEPERKA